MMRKIKYLLIFLLLTQSLRSQESTDIKIYLLTCGPGTEVYSVYGHSALRIVIPENNSDLVYNWGVFDFATPNFGWQFAKGRLLYSLGVETYENFLRTYYEEKRWVVCQRINFDAEVTGKLFELITVNLRPENINYRYNFFDDNCSTRIRDLMEKAAGPRLIYPPEESGRELSTYRELSGEYEKGYPWTKLGIDFLLGSPSDRKATFRGQMFLPVELKNGLSKLLVKSDTRMIPLLANPETVLDFSQPVYSEKIFSSPLFVFSLLLIVIIIITGYVRGKRANNIIDIVLFGIFSFLAVMMIFVNFFTLHPQLRWNLNILWLSPFVILCLVSLILRKNWLIWFRLVFFLSAGFLALAVVLPQKTDNAFIPVIVIVILRSSVRSAFLWNPFTIPYLTEL